MGPFLLLCLCILYGIKGDALSSIKSCLSSSGSPYLLPTDSTFSTVFQSRINNLAFASTAKPVLISLPTTDAHVQSLVNCYSASYLQDGASNRLQLKIRGGGHSYPGYSYVAEKNGPFILVDLQKLNQVTIDATAKTAVVGGGILIQDLYNAIDNVTPLTAGMHFGFPAGTCPTVGLGGHIQGGGVGELVRKFGLASDNLLAATIVTADGNIRKISASTDSDLFWAVRGGGGGNWGIITSFTLNLVLVPATIVTFAINIPSASVVNAAMEFQKWIPTAPADVSFLGFAWSGSGGTFDGWYLGSDGVAGFQALVKANMPTVASFITTTSIVSQSFVEHSLAGVPGAVAFKGKSIVVTSALDLSALQLIQTKLASAPSTAYILFDGYGAQMWNVESSSTAFPYRKNALFTIQFQVTFAAGAGQAETDWINSFHSSLIPLIGNAAYINYLDSSLGEWTSTTDLTTIDSWNKLYYGSNFNRLATIKAKYDPNNIFESQQGLRANSSTSPSSSAFKSTYSYAVALLVAIIVIVLSK